MNPKPDQPAGEPRSPRSSLDPSRRRALGLLAGAGAGLVGLVACGDGGGDSSDASRTTTSAAGGPSTSAGPSSSTSTSTSTTAGGSSTTGAGAATVSEEIPEETGGPYPADGTNGPDVLTQAGVVRQDITTSFGSASGRTEGVPLTIELTLVDVAGGGGPKAGAAVYAWHCSREGEYSLYSPGATDQNWLRGVQAAGDDGTLSFTTVFPGCYPGRWPHVHFEVYASVDDATGGGPKLVTSQLALPEEACDQAYAADGYSPSVGNLAQLSLDRDMVFSDGYSLQLATVTGSVADGFTARLNVGV